MVERGDILVVDWRGHLTSAGSGSRALALPIRRGLAGVVIDGAWRDVGELQAADLPMFGRGIATVSPPKEQIGEINVPVACGGVVVEPGDLVVADVDGIAVVPRRAAAAVAGPAAAKLANETLDQAALEQLAKNAELRGARYIQMFEAAGGVLETRTLEPAERPTLEQPPSGPR